MQFCWLKEVIAITLNMQNFLLNIFITMVLCSIWLHLRSRQDFLGSTLLSGPIKKEKKLLMLPPKIWKICAFYADGDYNYNRAFFKIVVILSGR